MEFTGERFFPGAADVEPTFQQKMWQEHLNRYQFAGFFVKGKKVLDLGCGVGYGANYLISECKPKSVVGVDLSKEAIGFAKSHYKKKGLKFLVGDAEKTPLPDRSVDVVIALELIEHVSDHKKLLAEVKRVLRRNGVFIVSTPRKKEVPQSAFHTHEFTLEEFKEALGAHFRPLKFYSQNRLHIVVTTDDYTFARGFGEIKTVKDLSLEGSDYFLAVCGPAKKYPRSLGVFNDDSYPVKLEKDVSILRGVLEGCQRALEECQSTLAAKERELVGIYESRSWKLVQKLRRVKRSLPIVKKL